MSSEKSPMDGNLKDFITAVKYLKDSATNALTILNEHTQNIASPPILENASNSPIQCMSLNRNDPKSSLVEKGQQDHYEDIYAALKTLKNDVNTFANTSYILEKVDTKGVDDNEEKGFLSPISIHSNFSSLMNDLEISNFIDGSLNKEKKQTNNLDIINCHNKIVKDASKINQTSVESITNNNANEAELKVNKTEEILNINPNKENIQNENKDTKNETNNDDTFKSENYKNENKDTDNETTKDDAFKLENYQNDILKINSDSEYIKSEGHFFDYVNNNSMLNDRFASEPNNNKDEEEKQTKGKQKDVEVSTKSFLMTNSILQKSPEIEKVISYTNLADVDLSKLNNIEILKLILDSLIQICGELLLYGNDILTNLLETLSTSPTQSPKFTKQPYSMKQFLFNYQINNETSSATNDKKPEEETIENKNEEKDENNNEKETLSKNSSTNTNDSHGKGLKLDISDKSGINQNNNDNNQSLNLDIINDGNNKESKNTENLKAKEISISTSSPKSRKSTNSNSPKDLLNELECLIILIYSLYNFQNAPMCQEQTGSGLSKVDESSKQDSSDVKSQIKENKLVANDSVSSVIDDKYSSNTELNSVIGAIDWLLKVVPRLNNQCVQMTDCNKKKMQLMGVFSVIDRMTKTRLNDQRADPKQFNRLNKLIELLNNSVIRTYTEQRYTLSPEKVRKIEIGRLQHLVNKSNNKRYENQDWCNKNLLREKELEEMLVTNNSSKRLENQRFHIDPLKERNMYFESLLTRMDRLDSRRLRNQEANNYKLLQLKKDDKRKGVNSEPILLSEKNSKSSLIKKIGKKKFI